MGSQLEESTTEEEQELGKVSSTHSLSSSDGTARGSAMREGAVGGHGNALKDACTNVAVLTFPSLSFSLSVLARSDGVSHACSLLRIW